MLVKPTAALRWLEVTLTTVRKDKAVLTLKPSLFEIKCHGSSFLLPVDTSPKVTAKNVLHLNAKAQFL